MGITGVSIAEKKKEYTNPVFREFYIFFLGNDYN